MPVRREARASRIAGAAEHQQDDAEIGELVGDPLIGDEARRERS